MQEESATSGIEGAQASIFLASHHAANVAHRVAYRLRVNWRRAFDSCDATPSENPRFTRADWTLSMQVVSTREDFGWNTRRPLPST
jgi:hypothetical protein